VNDKPASAPDGRDERWAAHREERREKILDAAIAVIEQTPEGEEIHVRQIAQEAGLGRAVLYRHFADKADLDRAVQRRILEMLVDTLTPEFELSGSIEQIISRIVHAYVAWADARPWGLLGLGTLVVLGLATRRALSANG